MPDFFVMAAPFTAFHANGSVNPAAVLPQAKLFKEKLGITAVWVMGARLGARKPTVPLESLSVRDRILPETKPNPGTG